MKFSTFFLISTPIIALCAYLQLFIIYPITDLEPQNAVIAGLCIGYANAVIGYATIYWAFNKSNVLFMSAVLGGMIFRFLLIFASLFILIVGLNYDGTKLVVSLLMVYIIFLILEIVLVLKSANAKQTDS